MRKPHDIFPIQSQPLFYQLRTLEKTRIDLKNEFLGALKSALANYATTRMAFNHDIKNLLSGFIRIRVHNEPLGHANETAEFIEKINGLKEQFDHLISLLQTAIRYYENNAKLLLKTFEIDPELQHYLNVESTIQIKINDFIYELKKISKLDKPVESYKDVSLSNMSWFIASESEKIGSLYHWNTINTSLITYFWPANDLNSLIINLKHDIASTLSDFQFFNALNCQAKSIALFLDELKTYTQEQIQVHDKFSNNIYKIGQYFKKLQKAYQNYSISFEDEALFDDKNYEDHVEESIAAAAEIKGLNIGNHFALLELTKSLVDLATEIANIEGVPVSYREDFEILLEQLGENYTNDLEIISTLLTQPPKHPSLATRLCDKFTALQKNLKTANGAIPLLINYSCVLKFQKSHQEKHQHLKNLQQQINTLINYVDKLCIIIDHVQLSPMDEKISLLSLIYLEDKNFNKVTLEKDCKELKLKIIALLEEVDTCITPIDLIMHVNLLQQNYFSLWHSGNMPSQTAQLIDQIQTDLHLNSNN